MKTDQYAVTVPAKGNERKLLLISFGEVDYFFGL
jgi:hypothetical protein